MQKCSYQSHRKKRLKKRFKLGLILYEFEDLAGEDYIYFDTIRSKEVSEGIRNESVTTKMAKTQIAQI